MRHLLYFFWQPFPSKIEDIYVGTVDTDREILSNIGDICKIC